MIHCADMITTVAATSVTKFMNSSRELENDDAYFAKADVRTFETPDGCIFVPSVFYSILNTLCKRSSAALSHPLTCDRCEMSTVAL